MRPPRGAPQKGVERVLQGDGVRLLRLLEQATPKERRGFMVDTKGSRTKELFDRAESLEITIMELLKRDIHDRTTDL